MSWRQEWEEELLNSMWEREAGAITDCCCRSLLVTLAGGRNNLTLIILSMIILLLLYYVSVRGQR